MNRKQFLKWIGIGSAGLATGAGISSIGDEKSGLLCKIRPGIVGVNKETSIPGNPGNNSYGSMVHPPFHIDPTFFKSDGIEESRNFFGADLKTTH